MSFMADRVQGAGRRGQITERTAGSLWLVAGNSTACVDGIPAGAGDQQGEHHSDIDDDQLAVIGAAAEELEVMDENPRHEQIDERPERGRAREEAKNQQRHADAVSDHGEQEAGHVPDVDGIGEVRRHRGVAGELFEAMLQEQRSGNDEAQDENAKVLAEAAAGKEATCHGDRVQGAGYRGQVAGHGALCAWV